MNSSEFYLICFGIGLLWSVVSVVMGAAHSTHGHIHIHVGHGHHVRVGGVLGVLLTPAGIAVFLVWFGGIGYILTRHAPLSHWLDLAIAMLLGCTGAYLLGAFLRWLQSHEKPLEACDTEMVGMLGRVSSVIRASGVGEMIFVRNGLRRAVPARSEDGNEIGRDEEIVVTRYEKGIAFVRTWAAMTQPEAEVRKTGNSAEGA